MDKKAEMGVGTLIVFIAMLLVAAVAAGVLIQTVGSLQEKSLSTGQQARSQISTNVETIEVSATDGRDSEISEFSQLVKLSPGSDPIKLSQVILTMNTNDYTASLKYKGTDGLCIKNNVNGYNTWNVENITTDVGTTVNDYTLAEDMDDDDLVDYMYVYNTTGNDYLYFVLSGAGTLNISLGIDLDAGGVAAVTGESVLNATETFAYVTLEGTVGAGGVINGSNADVNFLVTPYKEGEGYFSAEYEQRSTNWVSGNLQRGDLVKLCYESPRGIVEDDEIRLNFIPKIGIATLTQFISPEVMGTYRVYLYP